MTHFMGIKGRFFLLKHDFMRECSATHSISDARAGAGAGAGTGENDGLQAKRVEANPAVETHTRDLGQVR